LIRFLTKKKQILNTVPGEEIKLPFFAKVTIFLIGIIALTAILFIGRSIIVPIIFATIIAIMLSPVVDLLIRKKINRVIAIMIVLLLTFLVILAFVGLFISQVSRFGESWPVLVEKFTGIINQNIADAASYFDKDPQKIFAWVAKIQGEILQKSTSAIGQTIVVAGGALVVILLIPVYIFLILFYQPILMEFIHRLFGVNNHKEITEIVGQIKTVIQRYLIGLVIEAAIIAALDTLALLVLGIEYALLLGIMGALLNMIPYIGGLVAVAMPMMVALVTKTPVYALYVLIAYYVIQLIDNNYIVPKIVASQVKINALFSIIIVIAGNALWGIPGMFLSIPLLAIVKLVCDHIEQLKPIGFLLGDTMPSILKIKPIFKKTKTVS
jgi:predicted PurR-regulated permease PerM